jgi:ABC-type transporter Mla maintaining outer membrane lipid asymmetry permease subunit MlaE
MLRLFLGIGAVFGFLAALMAFLITWNEYQKHNFRGRRLFMEAFQAGLFTFIIFLFLSLFIGFILTNFIVPNLSL